MDFYVRGGFQSPAEMIQLARHADLLGFDGLTVPDHVFFPADATPSYTYSDSGVLPCPPMRRGLMSGC